MNTVRRSQQEEFNGPKREVFSCILVKQPIEVNREETHITAKCQNVESTFRVKGRMEASWALTLKAGDVFRIEGIQKGEIVEVISMKRKV